MLNLLAVVMICGPVVGPYVITEPGEYDFRCGGSVSAVDRSAVKVQADNVTIFGLNAHDSSTCVEAVGRSHLRIIGGRLERCKKIGITTPGFGEGNEVSGVTFINSGNGMLAYGSGNEIQTNFKFVGNRCFNMSGSVDGHCIGLQSYRYAEIAYNLVVGSGNDAIAVYWRNGTTEQFGLKLHHNTVSTEQAGITLRASGGTGVGRYNNLVYENTVFSPQPFVITGANTPEPNQWSAEVYDNYAPGVSLIRSTATGVCPRVYTRGGNWTGGC